jgi:hypothetical protein
VEGKWSDMSCGELFNIENLDEPGLMKLYRDATGLGNLLGIEAVPDGTNDLSIDETPAELRSDNDGNKYSIYFLDELNRNDRIMAIGHELGHLLLINKYCLKPGIEPKVNLFIMNKKILNIIQNVTHHLILVDLLWEWYRIRSNLHLSLLRKNMRDYVSNRTLGQEDGLELFEYKKLIGDPGNIITVNNQTESFQKAYESADTRFGKYSFKHVPPSNDYKKDVVSFLKDIGEIPQEM